MGHAVEEVAWLLEIIVGGDPGVDPFLVGKVRLGRIDRAKIIVAGAKSIATARIIPAEGHHAAIQMLAWVPRPKDLGPHRGLAVAKGNVPLIVVGAICPPIGPVVVGVPDVIKLDQVPLCISERHSPFSGVAARTSIVPPGRPLFTFPWIQRADDVIGSIGVAHPFRIAHLDCEDRAAPFALHPGQKAGGLDGRPIRQGLLVVIADFQTLEILLRDEVDYAADRLSTVECGSAVEDCLDPADGDAGIGGVDVDPGPSSLGVGVGQQAVTVDHGHSGPGAEAT